jgi:menaquinone-dependent protoporphyrinogen oxidase
MQGRVLVAYGSNAGSTADVARAIGEELSRAGAQVDVRPIAEIKTVEPGAYEAVIVGAPMIVGWKRDALNFVEQNRAALGKARLALFATAMTLTESDESVPAGVAITVDPKLAKRPRKEGRLGFKERLTTLDHYLGPILKSAGDVEPASVAFFRGKLDFGRLKFFQMLFVMLVVGAQPGDYRNWDAIRGWARELPAKLSLA